MDFVSNSLLFAGTLFFGALVTQELGRQIGGRRLRRGDPEYAAGAGVVDAAVFGLIGLIIAFSFSGAASRFDHRRDLIVEEANDIGTAYQRLDLLPAEAAERLREDFRHYVDARIATYRALPDLAAAKAELDRTSALQNRIWSEAVSAGKPSQPATMLLLPALNTMFDITTTRTQAAMMHPPDAIFWTLYILTLFGGALAGFSGAKSKERDWTHMILFALTLSGAVYIILDLEYPRFGLIRVDGFDQLLIELRARMG